MTALADGREGKARDACGNESILVNCQCRGARNGDGSTRGTECNASSAFNGHP